MQAGWARGATYLGRDEPLDQLPKVGRFECFILLYSGRQACRAVGLGAAAALILALLFI